MGQSHVEIYLHFVWATRHRAPLVTGAVAKQIYACILEQSRTLRCENLAIGGMPDHLHLAVRLPATVAAAKLMHQVKGVSSAFARDVALGGETFGWQDGYGVFSFSRSHRSKVVAYIQNQHRHHAEQTTWAEWESPAAG